MYYTMGKQSLCSAGSLRGILLLLNLIFVLASIALIGFGIYLKIDNNFSAILDKLTDVSSFEGQSLGFLAFVLIGGGVFTLLIALLGGMGSLWHNRCLLYIYAIVLSILMILELVGFIMALVYKSELEDVYSKGLSIVLATALTNGDTRVLDAFYDLEKLMKCCGVNGIEDYNGKEPKNVDCYRYPRGCSTAIMESLNKDLPVIGVILGVILLFELFGVIDAVALAVALKRKPDTDYSSNSGIALADIVPGRRRRRQNYNKF